MVTFVALIAAGTSNAQELTADVLHNATYQLTDPEVGTVTLEGCLANDAAKGRRINGTYHIAYGDFDHDGALDAVTVVFHQASSHTRVSADLVLMRNNVGKAEQQAAIRIGSTCLVRNLEVRSGAILLDLATDKVCDAQTCAYTMREIRRYAYRDHKLILEFAKSFAIDSRGITLRIAEKAN